MASARSHVDGPARPRPLGPLSGWAPGNASPPPPPPAPPLRAARRRGGGRAAAPPAFGRRHAAAAAAVAAAAAAGAPAPPAAGPALPRSPAEQVAQAAAAACAGAAAGARLQRLDLLLPVNEKEVDFNATEPIDYPCSLQREFDAACALAAGVLQRLSGGPGEVSSRRLDDGGVEGEPCALLRAGGAAGPAAVVFPTAERLPQLRKLAAAAEAAGAPLLLVNPQWRDGAGDGGAVYNLVGDFGIGPWRKAALDFLATFAQTYSLRERRVGAPGTIDAAAGARFGSGGVIRVLCCRGGGGDSNGDAPLWSAHALAADGASQLLAAFPAEPTYKQLEAAIAEGRAAGLPIFRQARLATRVFASRDDGEGAGSGGGGGGGGGGGAAASLSDADIEAMDAASLRRALLAAGEPASGRLAVLRQRLRDLAAKGRASG